MDTHVSSVLGVFPALRTFSSSGLPQIGTSSQKPYWVLLPLKYARILSSMYRPYDEGCLLIWDSDPYRYRFVSYNCETSKPPCALQVAVRLDSRKGFFLGSLNDTERNISSSFAVIQTCMTEKRSEPRVLIIQRSRERDILISPSQALKYSVHSSLRR